MKTIEEKARRYDEALEIAKKINNEQRAQPHNVMTRVFPELKEDEDEKIREGLINYVKDLMKCDSWDGIRKEDYIAYLEKQSEQKSNPCDECINVKDCINCENGELRETEQKPTVVPKFRIGDTITPKGKKEYYTITDIVDGWYEFKEKHVNGGIPIYYQFGWELVEQNPVEWSEKYIADVFEKVGLAKIVRELANDNLTNALQDAMLKLSKGQKSLEWSEEDENMMGNLIQHLKVAYSQCDWLNETLNWLKSLKDRSLLPKQEWSEEDENIRLRLIDYLYGKSRSAKDREDGISWLESLRPQNRWKPMEVQMKALRSAIHSYGTHCGSDLLYHVVLTLEKDLRAL